MDYTKIITVNSKLNEEINNAETIPGWLEGDEEISTSVSFPDGKFVEVRCYSNNYDGEWREDAEWIENEPDVWAEAILYNEHGEAISCTDPDTDFYGEWIFWYNDNSYAVLVAREDL